MTILLILSGCEGDGEGPSGPPGVAGVSGQVCITGDSSYRIDVEGQDSQDVETDPDPLLAVYQGNIGGQIRAVDKMNVALPEQEASEILVWGSGASIKHGTPDKVLGTVALKRPGAVTSLAPISLGDAPELVYATERGLGLIGVGSNGQLAEVQGAYRPVPTGVMSVDASEDGSKIVFTTGDGYLQMTSADKLSSADPCAGVLTAQSVLKVSDQSYLPVEVELGLRRAFVLAKQRAAVTSSAPTFEQVFSPIFSGMIAGVSPGIVRAVDTESHQIYDATFTAADLSFKYYDSFIPTDIALDGANLMVVGIAYKKQSVQDFVASKCVDQAAEAQLACMLAAAKDGSLTLFEKDGLYAFDAGFFVYRNTDDLSKADHFTSIPLTAFQHAESAPPFTYRIAVEGDRGFIRGPNFLVAMSRSGESASEKWIFDKEVDGRAGLVAGVPNDIVPYAGGAAASFTGVKAPDGSGASALEVMGSDGSFRVIDTGAVFVRVEGGGRDLVAAIEMASGRGGNLYIENSVSRSAIAGFGYTNEFVSRAAYDGTVLAFAWSSTGTSEGAEASQGWRIEAQAGTDAATRGETFVPRTGDAYHYKGFPEVNSGENSPWLVRGVGDVALAQAKLAVLYSGFTGGKWYYQVGLYGLNKQSSGKYDVKLTGIMDTLSMSGQSTLHAGKILRMAPSGNNYVVHISTSGGIYSWTVAPGSSATPGTGAAAQLCAVTNLIDASVDSLGSSKLALVSGFSVTVRDLGNCKASGTAVQVPKKEGTTVASLVGARVALAGNTLALSAPYGAKAPFILYNVAGGAAQPCATCYFLDVNVFDSFPEYLLASSISSGIEIYKLR